MERSFLILLIFFLTHFTFGQERPNVIIIYIDDLGYNDVGAYGAKAVRTPNVDWLAENGLRFTNGHSSASVCTPSRYALLTGNYAWRQKNTGIQRGNASLIVPLEPMNIAKVFKAADYRTAVVGKWHLGLGNDIEQDWNKRVQPGPAELGFDYSFIFPATADRTPVVFLENQKVIGLDDTDPIKVSYQNPFPGELLASDHPELLKLKSAPGQGHLQHLSNGIGRIGYMQGGTNATWTDEELGAAFSNRALGFIESSSRSDKPFFLYYAFHSIHAPMVPGTEFKGRSKLGPRGDVILEMDFYVGKLLNELRRLDILENTLIVFSSDNGPVMGDGYVDRAHELAAKEGHKPGGIYRGGKYSIFEAGTRVPFITYWPKRIKANGVSHAMVSQIDLAASFAALLDVPVNEDTFVDSRNYLTTFTGESDISRDYIIKRGSNQNLAIIKEGWKFIPASKGPEIIAGVEIESGFSKLDQLYNLNSDPQELINLVEKEPKRLAGLKQLLTEVKARN